ncbi:MAG: ATP-dependent RecD-like DNA helicase [Firmicutes bacterium]|nr:ATP-dependent RecD-like DNA helicase [Bacillota bacterium]
MEDKETISGVVEDIVYINRDNGYTICDISVKKGRSVTVVGYMPYITEGETIEATGEWTQHPEYGEQFKAEYCQSVIPSEEDEILRYLSSGIVSGVREATAKKLVAHFGAEILDIMLSEPKRLSEIKGISEERAQKIGKSYAELQSVRSIVMFLQKFNVNANSAIKVHNALGASAVDKIKENPYILADSVEGISFKTSDTIAFNMGLPKNSDIRIRAGIKFVMKNAAFSDGYTYLPKRLLIEHCAYRLEVDEIEIENEITYLTLQQELYADRINNTDVYYLYTFFDAEYYIARRLCTLAQSEQKFKMSALESNGAIDEYERIYKIKLASEQRNAVITALSSGVMVLTGGPGTGKTTVIRAIVHLLKQLKLKIALAAPTGRAAKRLSQVTDTEAKTIHRLLGTQQSSNGNYQGFAHNETNPLSADVLIVDEVSMIDVNLMAAFLRAVKPGARVIFSGDADQLPSVGPGNVLRDIIESSVVPVIQLKQIFRQAEESLIIVNAHRINRGEMPDIRTHSSDFFFLKRKDAEAASHTVLDLYMNRLPSSYDVDPISAIQVLSPTKKGVAGTENLNRLLQEHSNPPEPDKAEYKYGKLIFREGDKVMQIRNNYDIEYKVQDGESGTGIFNGDMGIIREINTDDRFMRVVFDEEKTVEYPFTMLDELDLAYAITVHKSQGSEFPMVIMPVCSYNPRLATRNLIYTAVTRAKDMIVLVGNERAVYNMVNNSTQGDRYTGLCERLGMMNTIFKSKARGEFEI